MEDEVSMARLLCTMGVHRLSRQAYVAGTWCKTCPCRAVTRPFRNDGCLEHPNNKAVKEALPVLADILERAGDSFNVSKEDEPDQRSAGFAKWFWDVSHELRNVIKESDAHGWPSMQPVALLDGTTNRERDFWFPLDEPNSTGRRATHEI